MKRRIVADSSMEWTPYLKDHEDQVFLVPFAVDIGEKHFIDDGSTSVDTFLKEMKAYPDSPKSAAPTPGAYLEAFGDADEVFVVTISSKLSASYNNAQLAKTMAEEKGNTKVHVFDSKSAASGETMAAEAILERMEKEYPFDTIVTEVERYIENGNTLFVLETLENLIKNGRISKWKGALAGALTIMPVMHGVNGEIELYQMARGKKNAYKKLIQAIGEKSMAQAERILYISHANAQEIAESLKKSIEEQYKFCEVKLTNMKLLSTMYANTGGIVIAF